MKQKQRNKLRIMILGILILSSILLGILVKYLQTEYQEYLYSYADQVANIVIEKYPEAEEELIQRVFLEEDPLKQGNLLQKYGINPQNFRISSQGITLANKITILFVMIFGVGVIGMGGCFFFYQKKQAEDVKELDEYCQSILEEKEIIDLKQEEEGAFSILRNDIYDMTMMLREKNHFLEQKDKDTEKLIADISHQIKTPLTSLNLINDLLNTPLPEEKKQEFLNQMEQELNKINWLVKTLLNIAKLDSKTLVLQRKQENANEILTEIKNNFRGMCQRNHAQILIQMKGQETILCDRKWTQEAIGNILKNALEHQAKEIKIQVEQNHLFTQIKIQDDGEGIDPKDLHHIFDRFYKAKNSKTDSLGLGLAFTKSIISNQAGEIKVKSSCQKGKKGTMFLIKLYHHDD